jgi:hypothetical protein
MITVFVLYGCIAFYDNLRIKEIFRESVAEESEKGMVNGTVGS